MLFRTGLPQIHLHLKRQCVVTFTPIFLQSSMGKSCCSPLDEFSVSNIIMLPCSAVTAKAQRKFAEDHTHIKMKEILTAESGGAGAGFEGPFGQKTTLYVLLTLFSIHACWLISFYL
jgi:hypothetical protein